MTASPQNLLSHKEAQN